MLSIRSVLLAVAVLLRTITASPAPSILGPFNSRSIPVNTLSSPYTVTAYAPRNCEFNGLKIETWELFVSTVASYCPFLGTAQASDCPNGTDMVLTGSLYPVSEVPGGQDTYVNVDGSMAITVQHEHGIPPGAYWEYQGWTWTGLPLDAPAFERDCPRDNPDYNCAPPTGYWTFKAPGATVGGVRACPGTDNSWSVYAVTPEFNRTDCVHLKGIGTHPYDGINPPVWAYY